MNTSESIKELAAALAKAQATMAGAKKDATNPHFRSKYADLASCWEAAKSALPANGLCVIQTTKQSERDEVIVVTRLAHASGEWIEGELALPVSKADAQGYGSALTYARRYGLCAITGIAPEDDDGNAAASAKPAAAQTASKEDVKVALESLADAAGAGMSAVQSTMETFPSHVQSWLRANCKAELATIRKTAEKNGEVRAAA